MSARWASRSTASATVSRSCTSPKLPAYTTTKRLPASHASRYSAAEALWVGAWCAQMGMWRTVPRGTPLATTRASMHRPSTTTRAAPRSSARSTRCSSAVPQWSRCSTPSATGTSGYRSIAHTT